MEVVRRRSGKGKRYGSMRMMWLTESLSYWWVK